MPPRPARRFVFPTFASRKSPPFVKTLMKNSASPDLVALANLMNVIIHRPIHGETIKCHQRVSFVFRCVACRVFVPRPPVWRKWRLTQQLGITPGSPPLPARLGDSANQDLERLQAGYRHHVRKRRNLFPAGKAARKNLQVVRRN